MAGILETIGEIKDAFGKYVVRPVNSFGLGGYVFDIEGDSTVTLAADITDHFTETNSAIQDHMAIKPKRVVLNTFVGELVHRRDGATDTLTQNVARKLNVVNSFLPGLTSGVQQALDILNGDRDNITFEGALSDVSNIWGTVKNLNPPIPRQQQAYLYFKALQETKQLVSVQTPFEFMTNMAIETIVGVQSEDSRFISSFSLTLKEIRRVSTRNEAFEFVRRDPIADQQISDVVNGGKVQGTERNSSVLFDWGVSRGIINAPAG